MKEVGLNPMVLRHTPKSRYSHYAGNFDELLALTQENLKWAEPVKGREGCSRITLIGADACRGFFSSVVTPDNETVFDTFFGQRQGGLPGELAFIQTVVKGGKKAPALRVDLILYHHSVLKESERRHEDGTLEDGNWQLISINASATTEEQPPTPVALARNHAAALGRLEGEGGTPQLPTQEQYMESILYWMRHAMVQE